MQGRAEEGNAGEVLTQAIVQFRADALLLRLAHLYQDRFQALALGHFLLQAGIGGGQLRGAFPDSLFQFVACAFDRRPSASLRP